MDDRKKLMQTLRRTPGVKMQVGGKGHWKIYVGDRLVTTMPSSGSDVRSVKNTKADLRRAGLEIS